MESKTYRILVLGPAFVGKTSFCKCVKYGNCISNNSLDYSYTKNPFSYIFKRDDTSNSILSLLYYGLFGLIYKYRDYFQYFTRWRYY